ncbi:DUF6525 family protein [Pseudoruegeria sp. SHC-113]|uniref:DUF6525 family protein n=1 Tax=Pseudoruegeria sp. SHC-113 TaxID=2855439 RepID=UPI0021BA661D|nr:DUF6525 family protein [Pseudoruegeria sp. SHC-113]MCT8161852.1 hypothetical protein [Pseudoruegeria sp. SHC-113]
MACRNLASTLPRRRRSVDPMRAYDALPAELRGWLAEAALPWSAHSAQRIWKQAVARGGPSEALAALQRAEAAALARDAARSL